MRKFKFTLIAFMAAMMALSFTACSDDDPEPNPNPDPEVNEDNYHFDLFVTVDKHGGMSSKNTTIVHSVNSLATEQGVITVKREGSELGDYSMETISKGKYYYQIPATNDRFVKYQIKNNAVQVIAERPFKANSYKVRSYTHAWIDDNTLVIMSTNGKKDKILYTKLNAEDLTILAEGEQHTSPHQLAQTDKLRYPHLPQIRQQIVLLLLLERDRRFDEYRPARA